MFLRLPRFRRDPEAIPSCGLAPLQGTPPNRPARHLSMRAPLLRICHRSAHSFRRSPHTPEGPTLRVKVRIQGFSPSFRLPPPPASQVYFTPLTPFGFSLQGFPLPRSRADSSPTLCRRAVLRRLASHHLGRWDLRRIVLTVPRSEADAIYRLRGFTPLESPFRVAPAVSVCDRPCPSWAFSSPGFDPPRRCGGSSPSAPPMCLSLRTLRQVTPTVRPPAALRSFTRPGSSLASLEAAFPS